MAQDDPPPKWFAGAGLAALRLGGKELATALKPFPDSISIDEPGAVLSPTQGEIAAQNRAGSVWGRVAAAQDRGAAEARAPPDKGIERE